MMNHILDAYSGSAWEQALLFTALYIVLLIVFSAIQRVMLGRFRALVSKTQTTWDDELLHALSPPSHVLPFIVSAAVVTTIAPENMPGRAIIHSSLHVTFLFVCAWAIYRALGGVVGGRNTVLKTASATSRALILTLLRVSLLGVVALMTLDTLGISITPLLASLGVGSVAVALALQDTLSNFFSGLYILLDEPIRLGDFVQVEAGIEGYVTKIGWRSTHLRMLSNNLVVIPNAKIASQRLINYDLGDTETAVLLDVGVAYGSDIDKVERVTCEVAAQVLARVEGGVKSFKPFIRFNAFADSSINFTVILRGSKAVDQYLIKHEFIKALYKRYDVEGIAIPFPQRDVHLSVSDMRSFRAES